MSLTKLSGQEVELTRTWVAKKASEVNADGKTITSPDYIPENWMPATVPGTVLTTLLNNQLVPDPFYGLNNQKIPDISVSGPEEYTYWFFSRFRMAEMTGDRQVWLKFRGLNYFADIYLNGEKVNKVIHEGMFLSEKYLITDLVKGVTSNRLAVYVTPPATNGEPNGGDGAMGTSVGMQFTSGTDWIPPVPDRNTGIWDKVTVEVTGPIDIRDPFVKTKVPGIRVPGELQDPAYLTFSTELVNATDTIQKGEVAISFLDTEKRQKVTLQPNSSTIFTFKELKQSSPRLWWPNGTGSPALYSAQFLFYLDDGTISDGETVSFGIREISTYFDNDLDSRVFLVNGQKIFIKGANWIASDAMLRLSKERYENDIKMHAEMNMNALRVWGGSMTERPDFYDACDKYGILVWQDLWITGDSNGPLDAKKSDLQSSGSENSIDNSLFIKTVIDQIKLLRNHPSLFLWCGGSEVPPPDDIDQMLRDSVFPQYDGTRYYLSESTSNDLDINLTSKTADGPFSIQEPYSFFTEKSFSFNPSIGSIGLPNITSLRKMMDAADLVPPAININGSLKTEVLNPVWEYHKYLGYGNFIERYGEVTGFEDFCMKAQLNNYEQYRSLQEGFNAGMWSWYTGMLVWKSQNPWTSLRGQLYDPFFDQNAGFYGVRHALQPLHVQLNLDDTTVCVVNTLFKERKDLSVKAMIYDLHGKLLSSNEALITAVANSVTDTLKLVFPETGGTLFFVKLNLSNTITNSLIDENVYWISTIKGDYKQLKELQQAEVSVMVNRVSKTKALAEIRNTGIEVSFFMKGMVKDRETGQQISPVYMDDNYITLMPGERKMIELDLYNLSDEVVARALTFELEGWNLKMKVVNIPPGN